MRRLSLFGLLGLVFPLFAHAAALPGVPIDILNADGTARTHIEIDADNAGSGMTLAVADLGTDGISELILGAGLGNAPEVIVLGIDGNEIGRFLAYAPNAGVGINVAACDLTGDGVTEIITAPQRNGGPHIRVFSNFGKALDGGGWMAYDGALRSGVNLACGDLNNDGKAELVTMPAPGGEPRVKVWAFADGKATQTAGWLVGADTDRRGLVGLVHDGALTVASSHGERTDVTDYTLINGVAMASETRSMAVSGGGIISIALLRGNATPIAAGSEMHLALGESDIAGSSVYEGDLDNDGTEETVLVPARPAFNPAETELKSVIVDLSQQRLFAYEEGVLANTFLVSTAKAPRTTPIGEHSVLAKLPFVHYMWSYGPGNPNNYDLGLIPWNLRIYPHIYIHYAPWHNNFGTPMSHGCINVNLTNIKWIYDWAEVGVPVAVRE